MAGQPGCALLQVGGPPGIGGDGRKTDELLQLGEKARPMLPRVGEGALECHMVRAAMGLGAGGQACRISARTRIPFRARPDACRPVFAFRCSVPVWARFAPRAARDAKPGAQPVPWLER